MDVILTIDTEADDQWDRSRTELTTDNLEFVPRFQELCDRYSLKPTYLCTWEVVEDPRFDALRGFQQASRAEIGAHLHPWTTPPIENPQNGIDRDAFGIYPSELDPGDVCRAGDSNLLEVPVTILFTRPSLAASRRVRRLYYRYRRTFAGKAVNKLFRVDPQWLRPYPHMSAKHLKAVCARARRVGLPAVEMMFHSSELMPGGSPYHPDEASIESLYDKLEELFGHLRDEGCTGSTLTEFAQGYVAREAPGRAVATASGR